MSERLRSSWREMRELTAGELGRLLGRPLNFCLLVGLPVLAVLFAGLLPTQPRPLTMLVAGQTSSEVEPELSDSGKLAELFDESSDLAAFFEPKVVIDPLARLQRDGIDLILNLGESEAGDWSLYTAETDPFRLQRIGRAAAGIERVIATLRKERLIEERKAVELPELTAGALDALSGLLRDDSSIGPAPIGSPPQRPPLVEAGFELESLVAGTVDVVERQEYVWWRQYPLLAGLADYGLLPKTPLFEYYPAAADARLRHIPATIALVLTLVPFLIGAARLGNGTRRSGLRAAQELVARAAAPAAIACSSFLLMIVLCQTAFGLQVKGGVFQVLLMIVPTLFGSACLGLALARLATSREQVLVIAGFVTLVCTVSVGASFAFVDGSSLAAVTLWLVPSASLRHLLNSWCFGVPALRLWSATLFVGPALWILLGWAALARRRNSVVADLEAS